MAADKKISELGAATIIHGTDISVLVNSGTDLNYTFSLLLEFLNANLSTGAAISYGTFVPNSITGKDGDLFIKTDTNQFIQRINGTWAVIYTFPSNAADGTVLYGGGVPVTGVGKNGDTYINSSTGIFYLKTANVWNQVFSMASGPPGPRGNSVLNGSVDPANNFGTDGDFYLNTVTEYIYGPKISGNWGNGTLIRGTNGNTILHGTLPPSNLNDGKNGDFYLNLDTGLIYGPKANGVWPAGVSIYGPKGDPGTDDMVIIQIGNVAQNEDFHFASLTKANVQLLIDRPQVSKSLTAAMVTAGITDYRSDAAIRLQFPIGITVTSDIVDGHAHTITVSFNNFSKDFFVFPETIPYGHAVSFIFQNDIANSGEIGSYYYVVLPSYAGTGLTIGSPNPIVLSSWQTLYAPNLGNRPGVLTWQQITDDGNGVAAETDRNDIRPLRYYSDNPTNTLLTTISIDTGDGATLLSNYKIKLTR